MGPIDAACSSEFGKFREYEPSCQAAITSHAVRIELTRASKEREAILNRETAPDIPTSLHAAARDGIRVLTL